MNHAPVIEGSMLHFARRAMRSRAALYGVFALMVAAVAIKDLVAHAAAPAGSGLRDWGPTLLVLSVAAVLAVAAIMEYRGHARTPTILMAAISFAAGPVFGWANADPAAALLGPLIGFILLLPLVPRGWRSGLLAVVTMTVLVMDVALLWVRDMTSPRGPEEIINGLVSVAGAAGMMVFLAISHRRRMEGAHAQHAELFNELPIGAFRTSPGGRFTAVNRAMLSLFGRQSADELIGMPADGLYTDPAAREAIWAEAATAGTAHGRIEVQRPDGTRRWVRYEVRAHKSERGTVEHLEGVAEDITSELLMAAWRKQREQIGAALKRISPSASVAQLAAAVCEQIVADDRFRYAGIFSIARDGSLFLEAGWLCGTPLLPQAVTLANPSRAASKMRERIKWGPWVDTLTEPESELGRRALAAGVRDIAYVPLIVEDLAVGLLLTGTGTGDRQLLTEHLSPLTEYGTMAASLMGPALIKRRTQDAARDRVRAVIGDCAFHPVYQPIVDLTTRQVLGFEALTRFHDGTAPDEMFAVAREAGLETELEVATLAAAVAVVPRMPRNTFLDLNASPDLVSQVEPLRAYVERWGSRVVIEITEHAVVNDYDRLRSAIFELGPDAVLAVDDAGAGFSSLRHILELRPQFVKLDRQFVSGIDRDPARQALAAGMAHFARHAGMTLIAEGVETEAEASALLKLRVPAAQGYLFGRPRRSLPRSRPRIVPAAAVRVA